MGGNAPTPLDFANKVPLWQAGDATLHLVTDHRWVAQWLKQNACFERSKYKVLTLEPAQDLLWLFVAYLGGKYAGFCFLSAGGWDESRLELHEVRVVEDLRGRGLSDWIVRCAYEALGVDPQQVEYDQPICPAGPLLRRLGVKWVYDAPQRPTSQDDCHRIRVTYPEGSYHRRDWTKWVVRSPSLPYPQG